MKKLFALLLALVFCGAVLVACGGGAPATLTKETIVGKWETNMGPLMGGGDLMVEIEFTADGQYITSVDKGEFRSYLEDLYEKMGLPGDVSGAIDSAIETFESGAKSTYSFDGETLKLAELTVKYTYKDGVLTITQDGVDMVLNYVG